MAARAFAGGPSQLLTVAIIHRETGRCLGGASLSPLDGDPGVQELGYALAEDAWGQGFATEAARALVDVAFEHRAARRVVARVFVGNAASEAVLRKVGFELEGTARAQHRKGDRHLDGRVYALTQARWQPSGSLRRVRLAPR
jgi:RimJ/RimL family protein N-acetyltransferase